MKRRSGFALAILILSALVPAISTNLPFKAPSTIVAEGGCPDGYEPYGVKIDKTGAYLVCRDKKGGGLVFVPLAGHDEVTSDA